MPVQMIHECPLGVVWNAVQGSLRDRFCKVSQKIPFKMDTWNRILWYQGLYTYYISMYSYIIIATHTIMSSWHFNGCITFCMILYFAGKKCIACFAMLMSKMHIFP